MSSAPAAAPAAKSQTHKKLPLKDREFSMEFTDPGGKRVKFKVDKPLFSPALAGELSFVDQDDEGYELSVTWTHPEYDDGPKASTKPFAQRKKRNDIREVPKDVLERCVRNLKTQPEGSLGCLIPVDLAPDAGGYYRVMLSFDKTQRGVWFRLTHVLLAHSNPKLTCFAYAETKGLAVEAVDCSHLCGNSRCCNIKHLCFEPKEINSARRKCHSAGKCTGHSGNQVCKI